PLAFRVKSGTLGEISSAEQLARGEAFVREVNGTEEKVVKAHVASGVRYDLLGKVAQATGLTRRTVAAILTRIREDTFANFAYHPEEFILKAAGIINEEKATAIIEHITYQPLEDVYETSIFTEAQAKGRLGANALPVEKSVFDYLIYDSENEKKFARELESEKDVAVYVKLPSAFFIDTPVGRYNPDWAIAFREGSVKHIYFVAETKGSMESMELRAVEQAKISCAKKHFRAISGDAVRYDVVDSYEALRQLVACP
ncbi:MAG: type III restriction endonuclease subunit R, partial [Selenomonas sp.]|nr:type III restriction endonuclease subunit R [Selenomonas sp.]